MSQNARPAVIDAYLAVSMDKRGRLGPDARSRDAIDRVRALLDLQNAVLDLRRAVGDHGCGSDDDVQAELVEIVKLMEHESGVALGDYLERVFDRIVSTGNIAFEMVGEQGALQILQYLRTRIESPQATERQLAYWTASNATIIKKSSLALVNTVTLEALIGHFLEIKWYTNGGVGSAPISYISRGLLATDPSGWSDDTRAAVYEKLEKTYDAHRRHDMGCGFISAAFVENFRELALACKPKTP